MGGIKQDQEQADNSLKSKNHDISRKRLTDNPDIKADNEADYVCPQCGKTFKSERSLKGHMLKAHGMPWSGTRKVHKTEEVSPKPEVVEGPTIPDPYEHLFRMLTIFGVSEKNAEAIVEFMTHYDVDRLDKLIKACQEYMPRSRLKLFVEAWCNVRGIPIPPEIQEDLGIDIQPRGVVHYPRSYRRPVYEDEVQHQDAVATVLGKIMDQNTMLLSRLTPPNPPAQHSELTEVLNKLTDVLDRMSNSHNSNELANLKERLLKLEHNQALALKKLEVDVQKEALSIQKEGINLIREELRNISRKTDLALKTILEIGSGGKLKLRPIRDSGGEVVGFEPVSSQTTVKGGESALDDSSLLRGLNARFDPLTGKIVVAERDYPALLARAKNNAKLQWYVQQNKILIESANADLSEEELKELEELGVPIERE